MLSQLPKSLRVLVSADARVVLQNALRESGLSEFDIADNGELRQFVSQAVELPAPLRMFVVSHVIDPDEGSFAIGLDYTLYPKIRLVAVLCRGPRFLPSTRRQSALI